MKKLSGNSFIKQVKGKILIDQVDLDEILKLSDTPLMIFIENKIRENIKTFKEILNSVFKNFECYYSMKANYLMEICKIICSEGIGTEVIGLPELKHALKVGWSSNKIIVGGPYLHDELIEESIRNQVKEIIVYDLNDLPKIDSIAKKHDVIQNVSLRINSQKYRSKLGVILEEENLTKLKKDFENCQHIKISSILSHYTSQMNSIEQFKKNLQAIIKNLKILRKLGIKISNLNLGGGFPEASVMKEKPLRKIALAIKEIIEGSGIEYQTIFFEPGRYIVGDSGLFITEIIKVSKNRWVFLNIGNHICPKFARCSLRFYNASRINVSHNLKTSFAGIIPSDQDVLAKNYFFTEEIKKGDKIMVTNVGAYTLTFSNRFPYALPQIYLITDDKFKKVFSPRENHDFSIF